MEQRNNTFTKKKTSISNMYQHDFPCILFLLSLAENVKLQPPIPIDWDNIINVLIDDIQELAKSRK